MPEKSTKVKVKALDSTLCELCVPEDILVLQLKAQIAQIVGLSVEEQHVIFRGIEINDEFDLSFYLVQDGDLLELKNNQTEIQKPLQLEKAPLDIIVDHYGIQLPILPPSSITYDEPSNNSKPTKAWCTKILLFIANSITNCTYFDLVHGPIIDEIAKSNPEAQGPMMTLVNVFLQSITVRQGAEALTGKWENFAPTQVILRKFIITYILQGNTSSERIHELVLECSENIKNLAQVAVPERYLAIFLGPTYLSLLYDALQYTFAKLLDIVLQDLSPTPEDSCPFATKMNAWSSTFFRKMGDAIWACLFGEELRDDKSYNYVRRSLKKRLDVMEKQKNVAGASAICVRLFLEAYYNSITIKQ